MILSKRFTISGSNSENRFAIFTNNGAMLLSMSACVTWSFIGYLAVMYRMADMAITPSTRPRTAPKSLLKVCKNGMIDMISKILLMILCPLAITS